MRATAPAPAGVRTCAHACAGRTVTRPQRRAAIARVSEKCACRLNFATSLIEQKHSNLVVINCDVETMEMLCWLRVLCWEKDALGCIINGKGRLGQLAHKMRASVLALTSVRTGDRNELNKLADTFQARFNENAESRRCWGVGIIGMWSQHLMQSRERAVQIEQAKMSGLPVTSAPPP